MPRRIRRPGRPGPVPVEPSSEGSGSTGDMLPKMAAAASSGAAPTDKGAAGTAWIQENPNKKAGKGSAGRVSSGKMLDKKAATVGGAPMVHPGKLAAGSGSTGGMLQKKADVGSSGGSSMTRPGKGATGSGSSATMLKKKSPLDFDSPSYAEVVAGLGSTGDMLQKKADVGLSGGMLHKGPKMEVDTGLSQEMLHERPATESDAAMDIQDPGKGKVGMGLCEEMPQKNATALSGEYPALGALDRNTTAQDCEESAAKHITEKGNTLTSAKTAQKNRTEDKAADMGLSGGMLQKQSSKMEVDTGLSRGMLQKQSSKMEVDTGLSGGMLQKQSSKMEVDTGLSEGMLHEHPAKESDAAKDIQDLDLNKIVHIEDESMQEVEALMQELNHLGKGEDISKEDFLDYYKRLPSRRRWIDLKVSLEDDELDKQENRQALYRLRYYKYKFTQQASKEELHGDKLKEDNHLSLLHKSENDCNEEFLEDDLYDKLKEDRHQSLLHLSEDDCNDEFLEEEGFFRRFEEDKTFDWFFHRDYSGCSSLNDYQCLVLKNYASTEYTRWSEYHKYLNSYETELEYVKYYEELTKQLKWMEDYVDTDWPCVKWIEVCSRGVSQAIKIAATSFRKITPTLAYNGFFECKESMVYDYTFYKELDGVYFEIWRRVTHGTKSFKEALEEVYNLNRFPSRQHILKAALELDDILKMVEDEFHTCTAAITPEVEDKAQELIKEAVRKQVNEPKSYEQYIRKKMHIASIIGILDPDEELR